MKVLLVTAGLCHLGRIAWHWDAEFDLCGTAMSPSYTRLLGSMRNESRSVVHLLLNASVCVLFRFPVTRASQTFSRMIRPAHFCISPENHGVARIQLHNWCRHCHAPV